MSGERDWDKELAEIDRLMGADKPAAPDPAPKSGPPAAPAERAPAARSTGPATARPTVGALRAWLVALLGPVGAAALAVWPYHNECGTGLLLYLVGVLAIFGAAIWTMRLAWVSRRATVMILGILTLLAACALAALEISPRVGYARASLTWTCST